MKKLVLASICTLALVGFVLADEFQATITKVEGNTVHYYKGGKKGAEKTEGKATATGSVKVSKGVFDTDAKKMKAGDAIEGGLKSETFTKIDEKGVGATITTNDKGEITDIVVGGKGPGGQAGKKGKKG